MANINIIPQQNEINQIKLKNNNEQYYFKDDAVRTAVSNIQVSLSTARNATSLSNTSLAQNDSFETAIGKIHTGLGTTEQVVEAGLNDLDARLNKKLDDYSKQYLTFTALQDTTFTFSKNALQYSLDNGATWTSLAANTTSPTINAGSKIIWKQTGLKTPTSSDGIGTFSATGNFEASGNIMSLYYGDNFIGQTDLTGKSYAFSNLFNSNTKLIRAENLILPATTLADQCYTYMFKGCIALTTAPELPATTLAEGCYGSMFYGCTSLTTAPELPATTLASNCYNSMFQGCTSLTTAPELPATTLTSYCYYYMFKGCTSLTSAPELPATTLADGCYGSMFSGCTNLNYIKCLATNIYAYNCKVNWVNGVAATGTFIKNNNMSSWTTGTDGIPESWTVYTDGEYKDVKKYELDILLDKKLDDHSRQYLTFTALESGTFTFTQNALQYSLDNGATWNTLAANTTSPTINAGSKIIWKQTGLTTPTSSDGIGMFSSTGRFEVSGNVMSLYYGDNFIGQTDLTGKTYAFYGLFTNCTKLIDASNFMLPATILANHCYYNMFQGCTGLTTAPELLAITLTERCYSGMFYGCTSLKTAPVLPATTLADNCYAGMFYGCTSLTTAPELPATTLSYSCYSSMFYGCTSLTTAPELPATTLASSCYSNMFRGCTSLITAPELPATTLADNLDNNCYYQMFYGCTNLNYIKCLATDISGNCTSNWVNGVAATGTFVKATSTDWSSKTGTSGIPEGWNVYTESDVTQILKKDLILDSNYTESSLENAALTINAGDSIQTAISKLHKAILDDEYVTASAISDLYDKIGQIESLLQQI